MTIGERPAAMLGESPAERGRRILDLGCGRHKVPGARGVDQYPRSQADVLADLDAKRLPVRDGAFDEVHLNIGSCHQYP